MVDIVVMVIVVVVIVVVAMMLVVMVTKLGIVMMVAHACGFTVKGFGFTLRVVGCTVEGLGDRPWIYDWGFGA